MHSALEIAEYIISHEHKLKREVSNLRLQKLLYFAQSKFLLETKLPCFDDKIEAWDFGPVVPIVWDRYKIFGAGDINRTLGIVISLQDEEKKQLDNILDYCKDYPVHQLTEISCNQDPWIFARRIGPKTIITNNEILTYFESRSEECKSFGN